MAAEPVPPPVTIARGATAAERTPSTGRLAEAPAPRRNAVPMRFVLGGAAILLAAAYLALVSLGAATVYYFTVGELHAKGTGDQLVRVSGKVEPGSVVRDGATLRFAVYDGGGRLPVAYRGVVPDIFAEDMEVVIEGRYAERDLFRATTLLTKCPSRFEGAPATGHGTGTRGTGA